MAQSHCCRWLLIYVVPLLFFAFPIQADLVYRQSRADFEKSTGIQIPPQHEYVDYYATVMAGDQQETAPGSNDGDSPGMRVDPNNGSARFPGVVSLEITKPGGPTICSGTLISSQFVLTAAHCFAAPTQSNLDPQITSTTIRMHENNGTLVTGTISSPNTSNITIHPGYGGFVTTGAQHDLAVLKLDSAAATVSTYPIRRTPIAPPEEVELVGYGRSGYGDIGFDPTFDPSAPYTVKRSGKNDVDLVNALDLFLYDFDGPVGGLLGGGTLGNQIETMTGPGDSGGPAFVMHNGSLAIAGVNTYIARFTGTFTPTGQFDIDFGGGVAMTNDYASWILSASNGTATIVPEPCAFLLLGLALMIGVIGSWGKYSLQDV